MSGKNIIDREKLLKMAYDSGAQFEKSYAGCVQAVLYPFVELFDLDESVIKAATSLSGGIARTTSGPCAAFTGGALVFGYFFGRGVNEFDRRELSQKTGELTRELQEKFINQYGGYFCKDVQNKIFGRSYDLQDPDDYQAFTEDGAYTEKCPDVVGKSAVWIINILLKEPDFVNKFAYRYKLT